MGGLVRTIGVPFPVILFAMFLMASEASEESSAYTHEYIDLYEKTTKGNRVTGGSGR